MDVGKRGGHDLAAFLAFALRVEPQVRLAASRINRGRKVSADEVLRMSFKERGAPDGRGLAVITSGGHPAVEPGRPCIVLGVEIVDDADAANAWFKRMLVERPWEPRQ